MSDEQQPRSLQLLAEAAIVEGCHHGLAGTGGGDDQVAPSVVTVTFDRQVVEHLALEGVGLDVDEGEVDRCGGLAGGADGEVESIGVFFWVVGLEMVVGPVRLESGAELVDDVGTGDPGGSDVPLETVDQGRLGEVGGPDPGGVEPGVPFEEPRLGVETGGPGVVGDLHVGALFHQPVESPPFGDAGVGGGDDPEWPAGFELVGDLVGDEAEAAPLDEGDQGVDSIR